MNHDDDGRELHFERGQTVNFVTHEDVARAKTVQERVKAAQERVNRAARAARGGDLDVGQLEDTTRGAVLAEAARITATDRNTSYGNPEDNFQNIADMWNAQGYRKTDGEDYRRITATDVALMMAGMKLARLKHNPTHRDSWVDLAGYSACGYEVANNQVSE